MTIIINSIDLIQRWSRCTICLTICQMSKAFVMRPLQIDRWRITIRNDNMLSVAVDTVKQKCFQAAFEDFGRARCGLLVVSRQPIQSSRSSDWKSPVAKSTVGARNNVVAVRGGTQCSEWRNVPCSREHVSNVCRRPTNGWLVDQQTQLV